MYSFLEKKLGRFAIKNLMFYVVMLYALGTLLYLISPQSLIYVMFDLDKIMHGEIWRVVSWLIYPVDDNIFFALITLYFYYFVGSTLERYWGSFRFNFFYFSGVLYNVLAVVIIYFISEPLFGMKLSLSLSLEYINLSIFFAFALMFSEVAVLLFMIIPIKVKYIAYVYAAIEAYDIIKVFKYSWQYGLCLAILCLVSLLNFFVFYLDYKKKVGPSMAQRKRKKEFTQSYNAGQRGGYGTTVEFTNVQPKKVITRHKCAVCGRTELDDDELEFRFCSKCEGNYEYCMTHLYTHTHIIRGGMDAKEVLDNTDNTDNNIFDDKYNL